MDFQKVLDAQRSVIDEYSLGNKPIRSILNHLQKASEDMHTAIEELDIKTIKEICDRQKTIRGFKTTRTIISGFYSYLKCKDVAEEILKFEHIYRIKYFVSLRHLKETFDNNVATLLDNEDILDKNRLGNLRMCVYLAALGVSVEEMITLKKSDYDFINAVLQVKDKTLQLPDFINNDIHYFVNSDGFFSPRGENKVFFNFIDTDGLIKQTRINAPITQDSIYQLVHRDIPLMDFDMTDVNKSRGMWQLLKEKGIDVDNPDVMRFYDLEKIKKAVCNIDISKKEMSAFIEIIKNYYNW